MKIDVEKLYKLVKEGKGQGIKLTLGASEEKDFNLYIGKFHYRLFSGYNEFKLAEFLLIEEMDEAKKHFLELEKILTTLDILEHK